METTKVTQLGTIGLSDDGKTIVLQFRTADGSSLNLEIEASVLENGFPRLSEVLTKAFEKRHVAAGQQTFIRCLPAFGFRANPSMETDQVVLTFQTAEGFEHHFSIASGLADRVCTAIRKAVQK